MILYGKIFPHTAHKPTHPRWGAHYRPKSGSHQSLTWWTMSPIGATHGHMGEGLLIEAEILKDSYIARAFSSSMVTAYKSWKPRVPYTQPAGSSTD